MVSQMNAQPCFKQRHRGLPAHTRAVFLLIVILFLLAMPALASGPETEPTASLRLSDRERLWLTAHPTVSFTGDPNWLPYEAFDSDGNYIGIVSEHLDLIAELTGLRFRISPSKTWTESTEKAKNAVVDILSETDDSDLKSHLLFTDPYLSNPIVIAMHSREHYVEGISHIKNRNIAVIKDYGYVSKIRRKYPNINFTNVQDIQHGLIAVSTGEVDALLCTLALCSYTIAELGLNNVKITGKTEFDTKLALGVQRNLPELVSILNKAIKSISYAQQQTILDNWIKQKYIEKTDYTLAYQVTAVAFILLAIFAYWNRRLSREINLRVSTEKELKSAQEVLRLSQQRLLLHREHSPLAIIEWNTDFEVLSWNPAAQRIFGFTKEEVLGQHASKNILPESAQETADKVRKDLLANCRGERSTNENITKDGRTILCDWYNTTLVNPDGTVIGVASLVDDITQRTQAEQELEQHRHHLEAMVAERTAALEETNKELESFSYSVSHDLRAPLRSIDGFSHALLEDYEEQLDDVGKNYLHRVRSSAQRMGRLIDDMLSLSRVMRHELKRKDINLGAMAQAVINKLQDYEPQRGVDVDIAAGIHAWGDAHLIDIALDNLLGNAWKYTGKTDQARIEFGLTKKNGKKIYRVSDNGVGFDMKYADKLFGSFQRLHRADEFEGTGIGLATVARIIRRHGGELWAEGAVGHGATFYFTLGEENSVSGNNEISKSA
jgi:two-component system sensor histidine kinase EvgS